MKASLKFIAVATLMMVANVALAHVDKAGKESKAEVKAQIFEAANDLIYIQLEKAGKGNVQIKISDQKGHILHTEKVKDEVKVLKRFDVSRLPAGSYFYEVDHADYQLRKMIEKD